MEDELDFSLPEKKKKTWFRGVFAVLGLILIALCTANLIIGISKRPGSEMGRAWGLSAEQVKQLAAKLTQRNLYGRAAEVWQEYLPENPLTDTERAKTLFQIGTLLEKDGSFDKAIEYYYRSEAVAKLDELQPQINAHIKDCFERLGKFSALRYELVDRTSFKQTDQPGARIVAEIGAERITDTDLNSIIESSIDNQLKSVAAFMTPEQLNEQKKRMVERYLGPQARQQALQGWLAEQILYREALAEGLGEEAEVKNLLSELARGVLSQHLMDRRLAEKIHITETDLQTYYEANKGKFVERIDEEDPNSERLKSFDEVRDQIMRELLMRKGQDVRQEYIEEMMDKYDVVVHTSAAMGADKNGE